MELEYQFQYRSHNYFFNTNRYWESMQLKLRHHILVGTYRFLTSVVAGGLVGGSVALGSGVGGSVVLGSGVGGLVMGAGI